MPWFVNGRVLDAEQAVWQEGALLVRDGRITAFERVPREGEPGGIVDLGGAHVLPGLIDCHVHLTLQPDATTPEDFAVRTPDEIRRDTFAAARATLLGGITTVRDCGGWDYIEMAVREEIAAGGGIGPPMFLSGKLIWTDSPGARDYPQSAEMPLCYEEIRAACQRQLDRGADFIKVMATGMTLSGEDEDPHACFFTAEELGTIIGFARERSVKVVCHAEGLEGIRNVIVAGADSLEHGTFADDAALDAMACAGIFLVPTCMVMSAYLDDPALRIEAPPSIVRRFEEIKPRHNRVVARAFAQCAMDQCLVTWQQAEQAIGRPLLAFGLVRIGNHVIGERISRVDFHYIVDQQHPDHLQQIHVGGRVLNEQDRHQTQMPRVFRVILPAVPAHQQRLA